MALRVTLRLTLRDDDRDDQAIGDLWQTCMNEAVLASMPACGHCHLHAFPTGSRRGEGHVAIQFGDQAACDPPD
jgi:hypothetical protein